LSTARSQGKNTFNDGHFLDRAGGPYHRGWQDIRLIYPTSTGEVDVRHTGADERSDRS